MSATPGPSTRLLLLFGVVSLAAVALGAWICAANGVPTGSWVRNLVAWGLGALAAVGLCAGYRPAMLRLALWAAPVMSAASFLFADQQGVHRWIDLGPIHANAAMLVLPAAVVALVALQPGRWWPWGLALAAQAILVAQPDASQATALGGAVIVAAWTALRARRAQLVVAGIALALGVAAWLRPDPLESVPEVEGIVRLAFAWSPVAGVAAALLPIAVAAVPGYAPRGRLARHAGSALGILLVLWAAMPLWGAFPVPFIGIGMSPIIGAWLGIGLLAGLARQPDTQPSKP